MRVQGAVLLSLCLAAAAAAAARAAEPPAEVLAAETQRIAVMAKASASVLAIFDPAGRCV